MDYQVILLLLTSIVQATRSIETFENSTNLCTKRCDCNLSDDNSTLYINCDSKKMHHTLANWPEHPKNLMATFSNNQIQTLERMPGSGAEDIKLIFFNCTIKYLDTGLFESTVNVKFLDLSHNFIEREQLSSDVFKGPYNNTAYEPIALEHLDLSYNLIHSLQKNVFEHTPNLKFLSLEGNSLRVIDHITCLALTKVTRMQILNLSHNKLKKLPDDSIKHFTNLTELNLANNEFNVVPESIGYVAPSLQILNISSNPIVEFEHGTFEGMENILQLFCSNLYELTKVRARSFTPMKHLKMIELSHNSKLKDIDEEAFTKITELEDVHLNDNALKTLSPNLLPWYQIRILNVHNNEFLCNCDLFNISTQLPDYLRRSMNVPSCFNPYSQLAMEIDLLTNETCSFKGQKRRRKGLFPGNDKNFRIMRITLTTLIGTLLLSASVATWLGYTKWKTYKQNIHCSFPHQIVYSPVATVEFPHY